MHKLLIVDDDATILTLFQEAFTQPQYGIEVLLDYRAILDKIKSFQPQLVILDINFGRGQENAGMDSLEAIRQEWDEQQLPVIMVSGNNVNVDKVTESLQKGANDILKKPVRLKELKHMIERLLHPGLPAILKPWEERLVGSSQIMLDVGKNILRAAKHKKDTLFLGETGTGKDLAARMFHRYSTWCHKPLITIYCTAIPSTLFEAEMFGFKDHAFTGARYNRIGRIQEANGGIVLLNEIGDLPLEQQGKLLNVIENKTITHLGSNQTIPLDIVILMATNQSLEKLVEQGLFRGDLYNRLFKNEFIVLPPLRERREDIPELVADFVHKCSFETHKSIEAVDEKVLAYFQTLSWEGNVRQLLHGIEFGFERCLDNKILLEDIQGFFLSPARKSPMPEPSLAENWDVDYETFRQKEKERLQQGRRSYFAYHGRRHDGNISAMARALGMGRKNLENLIKDCGLDKHDFWSPEVSA